MIDGQKLRAFREKRKVRQATLAREMGVTRQQVSQIERRQAGLGTAERYLNAVEQARPGPQARVTYVVRVVFDVAPMYVLGPEEVDELHALVAKP